MKIKGSIIILFVFLIIVSGCSTTPETVPETESTITVSGSGISTAVPDIVDIQLGVDSVNGDPVDAVSQNSLKMNKMMAVFEDLGIDPVDIQTVYYNLWVEEVYDQEGQPTGEKKYHVNNQLNIRLRDLDQIGNLIKRATEAGATSIVGITFGVEEVSELEQAALDDAIVNAREKADRIASEMGVSIGRIIGVNEVGTYTPPMPYYGEKVGIGGGGTTVPISQGQFSVTASVQVIYTLLP